jgi:general secretion pathway protein E/type IV pilus assembly protein PilB
VGFGENQGYIGNVLIRHKRITKEDLDKATHFADKQKNSLGPVDALVKLNILTEEEVLKSLASDLGMTFVKLTEEEIPLEILNKITEEQAKQYHIFPLRMDFDQLVVATHKPIDLEHLDNLRLVLGFPLETVVATEKDIQTAIKKYYDTSHVLQKESHAAQVQDTDVEQALVSYLDKNIDDTASGPNDPKDTDAPVIRLVSSMITEAFRMRASDIHFEPQEKFFRVRYRIDGILVEMKRHPKQLQASITSRVKLLADMKIAEKRLPQDGKIKIKIKNIDIDIRTSTLPGVYGESVVMRILDKRSLSVGIHNLGFLADTEKTWNELITLPNGVILITGPTGSGKTTTLYSCLHVLNTQSRKIITVEDPVEYQLTGINQVQVREEVGLTFSSVLRACLRQAPNIIMVGEIRDGETAKISMNAAFTGHLVFSTLHTNDAPGAITRLIDQGIQPFLVASAVRAVLAQRLVRKICKECQYHYPASSEEMRILGMTNQKTQTLTKGKGCPQCNGTGYKGRMGIFELLLMSSEIQQMVYDLKPSGEIRELAIQKGMRTLKEDGILKVLNGSTTVDELVRVTKIGEE